MAEEECADTSLIRDASPSEPEQNSNIETEVLKPVTAEEYFSNIDLNGRDIGRQRKVNEKVILIVVTSLSQIQKVWKPKFVSFC